MKNDLENEVEKKTRNQYASSPEGNAIPADPLSDFFYTKLGMFQVRSLTPNFTVVALKIWAYRRQNSQNC